MVLIMPILFLVLFPVSEVMLSSKEAATQIGTAQLKSGYVPGDFIIGAVFSVHERPLLSGEGDALSCGSMDEQYGIHRVESAFYAVDQINNNGSIIPGIKLGVHIKDACWSESIALRQTIKLIGDPSRPEDYSSTDNLINLCSKEHISPLIGVVGPSSSGVTIQVQNLLKVFQIPEIGYAATSEDLANTKEYPYFLRVVPSDKFQTKLIWQLLKKFNWTYVSIVYTNDNYGQSAMTNFRKSAADWDICIANYRAVDVIATTADFDKVITSLNEGRKANVIICYCDGPTVTGLFKSIRESNLTGRFTFILSDSWASRHATVKGYDAEAVGSIFISIDEPENPAFDKYFLSRNLTNNRRNPWFDEFWEYQFNCKINATDEMEFRRCTGKESLRKNYKPDSKIGYVIKSIYSMAYALQDMRVRVCNSTNGVICPQLRDFNLTEYMQHLIKVNFTYRGDEITFDSNREPNVKKYNILNYQKKGDNDYEFVQIGRYQQKNNVGALTLYPNVAIQFSGDDGMIASRCSDPCPFGSAQISNNEGGDKKCCWTCLPCKNDEIIYNGSSCLQCYEGFWPNETKTHCVETILKFILLTYSIVGIALTLMTSCIFLKYRSTPVVKSASKELCYIMLVGMIGAHSTTIIITTTEHTVTTCNVLRIVPPISFTFIYSALLVKTNRLARILTISKRKFPNMRPRLMSIGSQIVITLSIVCIQAVIIAVMFTRIPTTLNTDYHPEQGALYCSLPPEVTLPPFMFIIFLVLLCTVYAFETRNLPDNFSEAKFIGLAMYVTCITWIATSLIYYGSKLKIITMCIYSSTNALVVLSFLFFPKLYILICKPEQNTRANFVTTKGIRCIITGGRRYSTADTDDSNSKSVAIHMFYTRPLSLSTLSLSSPTSKKLGITH